MTKLLLSFLVLFVFYSCTSNEGNLSSQKNDSIQNSTIYNDDTLNFLSASEAIVEPIELPYINSFEHYFSNNVQKDTFKITMEGESVLKGGITFEIIDNKGIIIFSETYNSLRFVEYYKEQTIDSLEWEQYIIQQIDSFFDETNFCIYNNNPGFKYNIGGGNETRITYSKEQKKAIIYFAEES